MKVGDRVIVLGVKEWNIPLMWYPPPSYQGNITRIEKNELYLDTWFLGNYGPPSLHLGEMGFFSHELELQYDESRR
jgi:hypothetical protein